MVGSSRRLVRNGRRLAQQMLKLRAACDNVWAVITLDGCYLEQVRPVKALPDYSSASIELTAQAPRHGIQGIGLTYILCSSWMAACLAQT